MFIRLSFFVVLFLTTQLSAQDLPQWVNELNGIDTLKDVNKKRHQLNEIAIVLQDVLRANNSAFTSSHISKLAYTESNDGKVSCVAIGTSTYKGHFEMRFVVKESVTGKNGVWIFNEEIISKNLKSINELSLALSKREGNDLYRLVIKSMANHFDEISIDDLITKCYFEKLGEQDNDNDRDSINTILKDRLAYLWAQSDDFENSLAYLKRMKTIFSKDKKIKISTYNVEKSDFKHEFYGAVLSKIDGQVLVYPLKDQTTKIKSPERSTLSDKKWYGAIYLDIIQVSDKNKTMYTLIGYKGHDEFVKTRVLDVLVLQNNRLRFGLPVFKVDRLTRHRMIYKYSAGANMMLRYDAKMKMIVMDNLEPAESFYRGVHRFYGPDFSYNAFKFQKGHWEFIRDIDLRNPKGDF